MSELKNRTRFSTTLSKDTADKLKNFSEETMIPTSKIVDQAIKEYIAKQRGESK